MGEISVQPFEWVWKSDKSSTVEGGAKNLKMFEVLLDPEISVGNESDQVILMQ